MRMYYLDNNFVGRMTSFYGKAIVVTNNHSNGSATLFSYMTPVARVTNTNTFENRKATLYNDWDCSMTTLNHVKEFLIQYHIYNGNITTKEIRKDLKNKQLDNIKTNYSLGECY